MPILSPAQLAEQIEPREKRQLSYKLKQSMWASYNNSSTYSLDAPLQSNQLSNAQLTPENLGLSTIRSLCSWYVKPSNYYYYFDGDRNLYQACFKQSETLYAAMLAYAKHMNEDNKEKYQEELNNLETLAEFAKEVNKNNSLSRLLLILGWIAAIAYACAAPAAALSALINACVLAVCLSIFVPLGIVCLPLGVLAGLTFTGGVIVLSLGVGMALNNFNPSPQGSEPLTKAMLEFKEKCLQETPLDLGLNHKV